MFNLEKFISDSVTFRPESMFQHEPLGFHDYNCLQMNANGDHGIPVPNYVDENVSTKVVKIIQSYVGIVNKMVWRKEQ